MIADDDSPGVYYGFPVLPSHQFDGPVGFKLAYHFPGEATDPDQLDRTLNMDDEKLLIDFMNRYFPNEF